MRCSATTCAALLALTVVSVSGEDGTMLPSIVKTLLDDKLVEKKRNEARRLASSKTQPSPVFLHRHLSETWNSENSNSLGQPITPPKDIAKNCDASFIACIVDEKCKQCFGSLQDEGIDWASVSPETPCHDVTNFLFGGGHCLSLQGDQKATDTFCNTFDACVSWDDDNKDSKGKNAVDGNTTLDCDALTTCDWEGIHKSFVGDGICNDNMDGCYNHAICDYDGGDCCEDTCKGQESTLFHVECGHDGFACKNPMSQHCDPKLTTKCPGGSAGGGAGDDDMDPWEIDCGLGQTLYRLIMYDSFGDGWDDTKLTLTDKKDVSTVLYEGGLENGSMGITYICLDMTPACYHIAVGGGIWGNEVSWEIKPFGEGTRAIADGGAPMACDFGTGANSCERTCLGKPNIDPATDKDYKSYKEMFTCIQKKCLIQVGTCNGDPNCQPCFTQDPPEFCFANDNFNAVIDCGLCYCTEDKEMTTFCQKKATPGSVIPPKPGVDPASKATPCSADETLRGSAAVMEFAKCSNFDKVSMMVTDFDQNNFGALDTFEACAHSFQNDANHGGHTALGCMQILSNAMATPTNGNSSAPAAAISALAGFLYHEAEPFCECSSKSSAQCPLCPSFMHFKTLMYEVLDACQALDEIDCDAWNEFYNPCKSNIIQKFGSVDFTKKEQCEYTSNNCGGAGPFPAFRKLDCGREIPKQAWDFYNLYSRSCLSDVPSVPSSPVPAPTPTPGPAPTSPTPYPFQPTPLPPSGGGGAPYKPPPESPTKPYPSGGGQSTKPKKHRFLKFLLFVGIVGGGVYWYQKRRADTWNFIRYRQGTRNYGAESEMYTGLAMESGSMSSSFEPPTLPPPPSQMT